MKIHSALASLLLLVLGTEFTAPALATASSATPSFEARAALELLAPTTQSEFLAQTEAKMRDSIRRFRPQLVTAWKSGQNEQLEEAFDQVVSHFKGGEAALMKQLRIPANVPRSERILHVYSEAQVEHSMRELQAEIRHAGGYAAFKRAMLGTLEAKLSTKSNGRAPAGLINVVVLPFELVFGAIGLVILAPVLLLGCIFNRNSNSSIWNPFCAKR